MLSRIGNITTYLSKIRYMPVAATAALDIIFFCAIFFKVRLKYGYYPPLEEVFFSSPICYFWILWTVLIYLFMYGIYSKYEELFMFYTGKFPDLPSESVSKICTLEFIYICCKKSLLLFAGLPLVVLGADGNADFNISFRQLLLLLIPFLLDCIVLLILKIILARSRSVKG